VTRLLALTRRAWLGVVVLAAACVEQVVVPRVGVPTLDDPETGSFVAVSAGVDHTCALTSTGAAYCWGSNEYSQLGAPSDTTCLRDDRMIGCGLRPQAVSGGLAFTRISAGGRHTCGITVASLIYCWGDNFQGELGDPSVRISVAPLRVAVAGTFSDVAAGAEHACALRTDGIAFCWGSNDYGQLGLGTFGLGSSFADSVRTNLRFVELASAGDRICARTGDGAVFCWGTFWIAIPNGNQTVRPQVSPQRILPAPPFKSLAVGINTTCGIAASAGEDNNAYCWEANPAGSIGDGTVTGSTAPRLVRGPKFVAVSSGERQTCGIADSGFAYCWGAASLGQLGTSPALLTTRCGESREPCSTVPIRVSGWRVFTRMTSGRNHACGLTMGGNIYCWGAGGLGQRGDGTTHSEWSPVRTAEMAPL
jgi:alpha-tubulin suppressor-like RCC1 family protein